jgi:hypothetical protein
LQTVDENSNILNEFDFISNDYNHPLIPNEYIINTEIENNNDKQTIDDMNAKLINQKLLTIVRSTPLDAIVEDLNEENSDEFEETIEPIR